MASGTGKPFPFRSAPAGATAARERVRGLGNGAISRWSIRRCVRGDLLSAAPRSRATCKLKHRTGIKMWIRSSLAGYIKLCN